MKPPVTLADVQRVTDRLDNLKHTYLSEHGWVLTCETPGRYSMWRKLYKEDYWVAPISLALSIEQAICESEENI